MPEIASIERLSRRGVDTATRSNESIQVANGIGEMLMRMLIILGTVSPVFLDQPTVVLSEVVGIQSSQTLRVEQQILFYLIPNGV